MYDVPICEPLRIPASDIMQIDLLEPRQPAVYVDDAVAAVVAAGDCDALGAQVDEEGVEGGEAGGVG